MNPFLCTDGYKVLNPHIGAIYGDSITPARAKEICARLEAKGFASTNIVLGIGSFTYQYVTRDTHGFAMKATYVEITEIDQKATEKAEREMQSLGAPGGYQIVYKTEGREIFKDPITGDGSKKSAKGLLSVWYNDKDELYLLNSSTEDQESRGELQVIFEDGKFSNEITLTQIRERLDEI